MSRSDFDIDLRFGEEGESYVKSLLNLETIEVKRDRRWKDTGNLYIEVWCWSDNKKEWYPSGLQTTKATHWSFVLEKMVITVPVEQLIKAVKKYGQAKECGIPPNFSKGYLLTTAELMQSARF